MLTRAYGKVTGIAKGAKRSQRRFGNCLEPFTRVDAYFAARSGASLVFLERCELRHAAQGMVVPLRFAYGSYLLELVDQLTVDDHPVPDVFDLLDVALEQIESGPITAALLRAFELQLLRILGWAPRLDRCSRCQSAFESGKFGYFHGTSAAFLCARCQENQRGAERVPASILSALAHLQEAPLSACRDRALEPALAQQAALVTGRLLAPHLRRPLRSLELIARLSRGES